MSLVTRNILIAFCITAAIGASVIYAVNYLNGLRIHDLDAIQEKLSVDTLSLETQISLLESAPCTIVGHGTDLTSELDDLGRRLSYTENQLGSNDPQVILLKKQYSLLEIRDYLVTQEFARSCNTKQVTVLYFYSNSNCADCDRAGNALSYLHDTYPNVRVYSFDYDLDLGAQKTLVSIKKIAHTLPAFVIAGKTSYGFTDLTTLERQFPKGVLIATTSSATSTPAKK
jgi:thiol-disulfide isomerase/thioredoxin